MKNSFPLVKNNDEKPISIDRGTRKMGNDDDDFQLYLALDKSSIPVKMITRLQPIYLVAKEDLTVWWFNNICSIKFDSLF